MRIMGLDFGSKTCGVALSDELLMTAQPVEIIRRDRAGKIRKTLSRIEEICGLERRTGLPIVMSDERLTTVEAYEIMDKMEISHEERGRYVDMIAASIILQEYMENHREELSRMKGADHE